MLSRLTIHNVAIIDRVEIALIPGLNVMTGETGAGKSIVIDAVGGLLGERLGADIIRAGANSAYVEGIFEIPAESDLAAAVAEAECDVEDGALIVSREISRSGRSVARINGRAVPVSALQRLGRALIDVHGQSDHLSILRVSRQLDYLDGYAGLQSVRREFREKAQRLYTLRREQEELLRDQRDRARQLDLLTFQISEILSAGLQPNEDEILRQERVRLANAEKLAEAADLAREALDGSSERTALDLIGEAARAIETLARIDPSLADLEQLIAGVSDQITEIGRRLRRYREEIEFNPARIEEIEERIDQIRMLMRKYGATIEDVLAFADQAERDRDRLAHSEERAGELGEIEADLLAELGQIAFALSERRQSAATELARAIERELAELNMARARFSVVVSRAEDPSGLPYPDGKRYAFELTGADSVEFFIAPNAGEELKPLARIASGGETARLMLALKTVLARADVIPTLIFDEIDVGIGGRTGSVVGMKLATLARERQLICVTHLPQIACYAEAHFAIEKRETDGRTQTTVRRLDDIERVREVSVMLGGSTAGGSALDVSREMIDTATRWKETLARE